MSQSIESASKEWRNGLIDVGGNNRLLNYRNGVSTLVLDDSPVAALKKLFDGSQVRLSELFTDVDSLQKAQKACVSLARKQREAVEEYGITVTYLAVGMASWDPEGNPGLTAAESVEVGETEIKPKRPKYTRPRAPLFLRPIEIELRRGAQQSWTLKLLDEFQINGVLTHVLNADKQRIHADVMDEYDSELGDIESMNSAIEAACEDIADFAIDATVLIGAFSYAKQPMVDDVSDLVALEGSDIVSALSGDVFAAERVRATVGEVTDEAPDYTPVAAEYLILDADASQSYVVNAALAGRNLVVEGPPGTGKSQTIANIIATSAAAGRTVLFVAQKRAAISAVLERLNRIDLNHLVLDVFAAASSRRFVADQLLDALEKQKAAGQARTDELHFSLSEARDRLVRRNTAMHAPSRGWGISVAELIANSLAVPENVQTNFRVSAAVLAKWAEIDPVRHRAALTELSELGSLQVGWSTEEGWSPSKIIDEHELRLSNERLSELQAKFAQTAEIVLDVTQSLGLPLPTNWGEFDGITAQLEERDRVLAVAPATLEAQYSTEEIRESLLAISRPYRKLSQTKLARPTRRIAARRARLLVGQLPRSERKDLLGAALNLRTAWIGKHDYAASPNWRPIARKVSAYRDDLAKLDTFLQGISLADSLIEDLPAKFLSLAKDPRRRMMPRTYAVRQSLIAAGLGPLLVELEARDDVGVANPQRAGQILDRVTSASLLDEALLFDSNLSSGGGHELNRVVDTFQRGDRGHLDANAVRIRRLAAERLKLALDSNPEQHLILKKEVTRKARFTPVRRLLQEVPDVILAAKPIWAMSPLQVSRLLPREQLFDVVIFDEASQVKPADAIPAILRGRQLIVAGDSRQLPPTEFFAKTLEDVDEDELDEDTPLNSIVDEVPVPRRLGSLTRDAESILFAMDRLLAGQSRRLLWHYRSRDERLITVSNKHVYDSSLTTFPAADTPDAIKHIEVPYSPGIGGGTNSPEAEVSVVVEAVKSHALLHPEESLGVIAFGIKHQNRLENALERAFADDPNLFEKLNSIEPFFVKSIERVQGDERDAIILTVGYGKSADGQLRLFWGPLLQNGGDRRLNVAISRAKRRLTLVSSFSADDMAEDGHASRGYKLMYHFIRFVGSGGTDASDGPNRGIPLNAFEMDVRDRLESAGLRLDCQVGVGSYRLDFAARHPSKPGKHVLAIEADGAAYHSGHTARERDRLRQQLLEARGWVFHRIWSTDWFNDADAEIEAALAAFNDAVERSDSEDPVPALEPTGDWELAVGQRQEARPAIPPGYGIDDYDHNDLMRIVHWVRSDHVVRSADDELAVVMGELGFGRRGAKIVRRISEAQTSLDLWLQAQ